MAYGIDGSPELRSEHLGDLAVREVEKRLERQIGRSGHKMIDAIDVSEEPLHIRFIRNISLMCQYILPKLLYGLGEPCF